MCVSEHKNIYEAMLPVRYERRFTMHLYWTSHGLLLLRSGKSKENLTRVDILFRDVTWMTLPTWFDGLEIVLSSAEALPFRLPTTIQREIHSRRVYRLTTDGVDHFIVASKRISIAEDDGHYFEDSLLIPDLRVTQAFPQ
jgi:hypothetical protein